MTASQDKWYSHNAILALRSMPPKYVSDWISLFEAVTLVSRRINSAATGAFHSGASQLRKSLHDGAIEGRCDFVVARANWEPIEDELLSFPAGPADRISVPPGCWLRDNIYWRHSMVCDGGEDATHVYGNIRLRQSDIDRLWPNEDGASRSLERSLALADEKLFSQIDQERLENPSRSITQITLDLAAKKTEAGGLLVQGVGTPASRAKRLARNYGRSKRISAGPTKS